MLTLQTGRMNIECMIKNYLEPIKLLNMLDFLMKCFDQELRGLSKFTAYCSLGNFKEL